jgi:DNA-directed RNA polymerase specialized sigma24 family protein
LSPEDVLKDDRVLSQLAFNRLLQWLDDGVDSSGENYLEMRRRLVAYFERRNRPYSDDLADETLNRIARTLETSGVIKVTPPARYCYVVAKFVLLEDFRRERSHSRVGDVSSVTLSARSLNRPELDETTGLRELRLECLDVCLQELRPDQRDLVLEYYRDSKREKIDRRRALAQRLGISINALGIRACRIRDSLEACVEACRQCPRKVL